MSQEHENSKPTDGDEGEGAAALSALRGIWKAQEHGNGRLRRAG
jgi:hypothetical protein